MEVIRYISLLLLISNLANAQLNKLIVTESELKSNIKIGKEVYVKDSRLIDFYKGVVVYSPIIGELEEKNVQSFACGNDKGNVLYFKFKENLSGKADSFIRAMLWRDRGKPTKKFPSTYNIVGSILIIYSFKENSKIKKEIESVIESKLKKHYP